MNLKILISSINTETQSSFSQEVASSHLFKISLKIPSRRLKNDNLKSDILRTETLHELSDSDDFDMLLYEKIRNHSCGKSGEQRSHVWYGTVQTILKLWKAFIQMQVTFLWKIDQIITQQLVEHNLCAIFQKGHSLLIVL